MVLLVRRRPSDVSGDTLFSGISHLLLELLVNRIESIFDCNTFQVSCSDFEAEREVKIDLLDRRFGEHLLQYRGVLHCACGGVELPERVRVWRDGSETCYYQPVCSVSGDTLIETLSFSVQRSVKVQLCCR